MPGFSCLRLRSRPLLVGVCALAAIAASGSALAWSGYGHRVTGYLAEYGLDDGARAAVAELLDGQGLAEVANWADEVRDARPATAPFHYINGALDRLELRPEDFALAQGNVYSAILGYAARLADDSLPRADRVEALKFLVHFVGDLHQPLHCGFAEDRGGNRIAVRMDGEPGNLHRYWDYQILTPHMALHSPAQLAAVIHAAHSDAERASWTGVTDPRDWVVEARGYLFAGLYPMMRRVEGEEMPLPVLEEAYRETWLPVAERQLARAGARLAWTLNRIFEEGESPFDRPPIEFPPG